MAKTLTSRLEQTRWSAGTDTVRRLDFDGDAAKLEQLAAIYGQGVYSARPAAGKSGRTWTVIGDADPDLNGRSYYDTGSTWLSPRFLQDGFSESSAANKVPLTVKGFASQTSDLLQVVDSAETPLLKVSSSGALSNQTTPGVNGTAGAYLGRDSSHSAAGAFTSVAIDKPVLFLRGANGQTENLITARNFADATVFSVSASGVGVFASSLAAASITSSASITTQTLVAQQAASLVNTVTSPLNLNGIAAKFMSISSHANNIVDYTDNFNTRTARITSDGSFATEARVMVGTGNGNSITQSYATSVAALLVDNPYAGAPAMRAQAHASQTANMFEIAASNGTNVLSVDKQGNIIHSGAISSASHVIGAASVLPYFSSAYQPKFQVDGGIETGTYDQAITVRHINHDGTAVARSLGLHFKFSSETNTTESEKWAGIVASTSLANAASPYLKFFTAGTEGASLDASNNFKVNGNVSVPTGRIETYGADDTREHWRMVSSGNYAMGVQASSMYFRASNFAWHALGSHVDTIFDPGSGGTNLMKLTSGSDSRLTVERLTTNNGTGNSTTTPALAVGAITNNHMQMGAQNINSYSANNGSGITMSIQNGGGDLILGSSTGEVEVPRGFVTFGSRRIYFDNTAPGVGPGDWLFDATNTRIMYRNASNAWVVIASA